MEMHEESMKGKKMMDEQNGHDKDHDNGKNYVTIYVNDKEVTIHRGNQTVAEIKRLGSVPATDKLYLMPDYENAMDDNGSITIKGDEKFKSSAPTGASS